MENAANSLSLICSMALPGRTAPAAVVRAIGTFPFRAAAVSSVLCNEFSLVTERKECV